MSELSWKAWLLQDYARYWYVLLCIVIDVFGVGEVLRSQQDPTAPLTLFLWSLLLVSVLALQAITYILIWRRDTPSGKRIRSFLSSLIRKEL